MPLDFFKVSTILKFANLCIGSVSNPSLIVIENLCYEDYNEDKNIVCDEFKEKNETNEIELTEQRKTNENSDDIQADELFGSSNWEVMLNSFLPIEVQHEAIKFCEEIQVKSDLQTEQNDQNVKQNGEGNEFDIKKYSNRRDVVYKNLLRGTRRYLWTMFSKEHDCSKLSNSRCFGLYKEYIDKFYDNHFREFGYQNSEEYHRNCVIIMSIIISERYSYPSKKGILKKASSLFKIAIKRFNRGDYISLFSYTMLSDFFKLLVRSKIAQEIMKSNQSMQNLRDKYEMVFNNIANFVDEQDLLPNEI